MLSVKQGGIKYHFLSLWYDSTWDWTQVSRAIGEHSNRYAQCPVNIYIYIYKKIRFFNFFPKVFFEENLEKFIFQVCLIFNFMKLRKKKKKN